MSTTTAPSPELTDDQLELRDRAREFVEQVLMPLENEAEERGGALPRHTVEQIQQAAIAARLQGGRVPLQHGGQGWSMLEWFLVNEQFGRVTNGLHWHVPSAYNVLTQGSPEQIDRYLVPALRGEGGDAYAVTEADAGSDPSGIATTAVAGAGGWRINGETLQRAWFTEERLGIATHGLGAMWRLLEETTDWALHRVQGGQRIMDYQGISFPLADSATDATLGRLLALHVAGMVDAGADVKLIHAKASMAKLFVSEAAGRCADRAVQAFGGRGYLRSNVAERFSRELRVDRIWEGTSEVQRLIIARALERRGVEATIH